MKKYAISWQLLIGVVLVETLSHGSKHDTVSNKVVGHVPKLFAHQLPLVVVAGSLNFYGTLVLNMQRHLLQAAWMDCGKMFCSSRQPSINGHRPEFMYMHSMVAL